LNIDGFDIGLEMSGNAMAFDSMLQNMYHGGKVALLGILPKGTGVDWDQVIFKGLELHGIYGRRMYETWYKMTQMVLTGFPLHKTLTHHIAIEDFQEGFELMAKGQCGKVVCDWTGEIKPKAA
ncbi:MAG: zinc-binding dehydrogenase, partial [Xanthomonadales bacterium]|nr:zinc-binding dehydrogenase [Xanthomonadales bacterium]